MSWYEEMFENDPRLEEAYQDIKNTILEGKTPVDTPVSVVLGGLPGSGKGNIYKFYKQKPSISGNIVELDCDKFRKYHPDAFSFSAEEYANKTNDFVFATVDRLIDEITPEKYNFIVESSMRTPEAAFTNANNLKPIGYKVEVAVMATDKDTAWQGTIDRFNEAAEEYERNIAAGLKYLEPPRPVDEDFFNRVVDGIEDSLTKIYTATDENGVSQTPVDDIIIYTRQGEILYHKEETPELNPVPILSARLFNTPKEARAIIDDYKQSSGVEEIIRSGDALLDEMAKDNDAFIKFLKFQGTIYEQDASVALEFFAQRPNVEFVATEQAWKSIKYDIKAGEDALVVRNSDGVETEFYDFTQTTGVNKPNVWRVSSNNAAQVKKELGIEGNIIDGLMKGYIPKDKIAVDATKLGISRSNSNEFAKAYYSAISTIIAGRLEMGGNKFNVISDNSFFSTLTHNQRLYFLMMCTESARNALDAIKEVVKVNNETERTKNNDDLRTVDETLDRREAGNISGRVSGNTEGTAPERTDSITNSEDGKQRTDVGSNSENIRRNEDIQISGTQKEDSERTDTVVQVQSGNGDIQSESQEHRTELGGRTDRSLRSGVDEKHGSELQSFSDTAEVRTSLSDSSENSGQGSRELQGTSRQSVRNGISETENVRGNAEVGEGENVSLGEYSNEGNSSETENRITETETSDNPEDISSHIDTLTKAISEKENELTRYVSDRDFAKVAQTAAELDELNKKLEFMKLKERSLFETPVNFTIVTVNDEEQFIIGGYVTDSDGLEGYVDFEKYDREITLDYEFCTYGGSGESDDATEEQCKYIESHLNKVRKSLDFNVLESDTVSFDNPAYVDSIQGLLYDKLIIEDVPASYDYTGVFLLPEDENDLFTSIQQVKPAAGEWTDIYALEDILDIEDIKAIHACCVSESGTYSEKDMPLETFSKLYEKSNPNNPKYVAAISKLNERIEAFQKQAEIEMKEALKPTASEESLSTNSDSPRYASVEEMLADYEGAYTTEGRLPEDITGKYLLTNVREDHEVVASIRRIQIQSEREILEEKPEEALRILNSDPDARIAYVYTYMVDTESNAYEHNKGRATVALLSADEYIPLHEQTVKLLNGEIEDEKHVLEDVSRSYDIKQEAVRTAEDYISNDSYMPYILERVVYYDERLLDQIHAKYNTNVDEAIEFIRSNIFNPHLEGNINAIGYDHISEYYPDGVKVGFKVDGNEDEIELTVGQSRVILTWSDAARLMNEAALHQIRFKEALATASHIYVNITPEREKVVRDAFEKISEKYNFTDGIAKKYVDKMMLTTISCNLREFETGFLYGNEFVSELGAPEYVSAHFMDGKLNSYIDEVNAIIGPDIIELERTVDVPETVPYTFEVNELLEIEVKRGSSFSDGKFRISEFYKNGNTDTAEFAEFLRNEYGFGVVEGTDPVIRQITDWNGMRLETENGAFDFTWEQVAEKVAELIENNSYINDLDVENIVTNAWDTMNHSNDKTRDEVQYAFTVLKAYDSGEKDYLISYEEAYHMHEKGYEVKGYPEDGLDLVRDREKDFLVSEIDYDIFYTDMLKVDKLSYYELAELMKKSGLDINDAADKEKAKYIHEIASCVQILSNYYSDVPEKLEIGHEFDVRREAAKVKFELGDSSVYDYTVSKLAEGNLTYIKSYINTLRKAPVNSQLDGIINATHENIDRYNKAFNAVLERTPDEGTTYRIYQLKSMEEMPENHDISFTKMLTLEAHNLPFPDISRFDEVYSGNLSDISGTTASEKLESLFAKFNIAHPADFRGHSLSVGDVVVFSSDGKNKAFFVDAVGFKDVTFRFYDNALEKAKKAISDYIAAEFGDETEKVQDYKDLHNIGIAYTTLTDDELPIQVTADLVDFKITHEYDGEVFETETFDSLEDMLPTLENLDFDDLIHVPESVIERHQTTEYPEITREDYNISEDSATDVSKIENNDKGWLIDVEINSSETLVKRLAEKGLTPPENATGKIIFNTDLGNWNKIVYPDTFGNKWALIDANKVFTDAEMETAIEIAKELTVPQQMTIDGFSDDAEKVDTNINSTDSDSEEQKENLVSGPIVDGVQVYEALAAEIDRGTGFEDGKLRVQDFYDENHPSTKELAEFLKKEYGTGGHTGEGNIESVDHSSKGIIFTFSNGEQFRHSWLNVAVMTESRLRDNTYLSDEQKEQRALGKLINSHSELARFVAARQLSSDEWESMAYPLFDNAHLNIHKPNENVSFGNHLKEAELFDLADRYHKGDDIREEIAQGLMPNRGAEEFEFVFRKDGKAGTAMTVYMDEALTGKQYTLNAEYTSDGVKCTINDSEITISNEELGQAFLDLTHEDYEDIAYWWIRDDLMAFIPDSNDVKLRELVKAFDNATMHGWETDQIKTNHIKKALYDILGSEELTDKAFEIIAYGKYNVSFDAPEQEETPENEEESFYDADDHADDDLPEITYAENPQGRLYDNIAALRTLKSIEDRARLYGHEDFELNPYELNQLRRYCGWGGLSQVFDEDNTAYSSNRNILKDILTEEEYAAAKASTLNAHFTPQIVIDAMYKAVKEMELPRDAHILEPACGTGNFISRLPASLSESTVVGVELDSITSRIAKWLNKENTNIRIINSPFEQSGLENNSFDLAIGNVPFGNYEMVDPDHAQDWKIHDAFFRKALDKVAAGGVVAFVTSTGTLDKKNPRVREYLAQNADLIGAIRLPNNTFSDAGTKTATDIVFLQKRAEPRLKGDNPDWCYTCPNEDGLNINSYFVQNPQMVLGKMEQTSHFNMLTCSPLPNTDLSKQLDEAIKNLNAKIKIDKREKAAAKRQGLIEPWGRNYTYQVTDKGVYYREGSEIMSEVKCSKADKEKISLLCDIRNAARELIDIQSTDVPDSELIPYRDKLNMLYDSYTAKYGNLSDKKVAKLFDRDADYPLLRSLEDYDKVTKEYSKAEIFTKRTVVPYVDIKEASNIEDALRISLDRKGKIDVPYMATLLKNTYSNDNIANIAAEISKELIEKEYAFLDPDEIVAGEPYSAIREKAEYLSGNVRMKLRSAIEYAETHPEFQRNVEALKEVIPKDIKAEEITVQMGCAWIDTSDYTKFLDHLSGRNQYTRLGEVSYSTVTGEFTVTNSRAKLGFNVNESKTYGTSDLSLYSLAEKILNQRRIVIKRNIPDPLDPSKEVSRTDVKATKIANDMARKIKQEFKNWIFADPDRRNKYERRYNNIFNSLVGRTYDGSKLTFSGMNSDFVLRPHQKDCVARSIYGGNTLAAHVVGAGKSAVIITSVMKKKEIGLINKACVVVPKPLTEQTAAEWRKLYPDAKVLTVTNADLNDEKKRLIFAAKVATGSYDAVIVSQEQFEKLAMSKEYRKEYIRKEIDELEEHLREIGNDRSKKNSVKDIETQKKKLQTKLEKIMNPTSKAKEKDDLLDFEKLGFDYLVVDEAHAYKNGLVVTKMSDVAGVTTKASGRAEDMQMKTDYFNEKFGQGHILFATGTPVSNSMTELYVMTRYLRPDLLKAQGVDRFDDWASTFGQVVTKNQQTSSGQLKLKTKFASFANLPELMTMYKEFADIQSAEKLNLPRPKLKEGHVQIIKAQATKEQKAYVKELAQRALAYESGHVDPRVDNHLKITGEARLVGLGNMVVKSLYDKREEALPDDFIVEKDSKVDLCIQKVAELYRQTEETRGVQIIFSDIAVNSDDGNFSVYDYIKKELTESYGIPENEIIFAPKSDAKNREQIFADINNAKYRVVIASTSTLGTGANIQQNLYALHHVDVPWKPSDFTQREGRILRQGNKNPEVEIFNYVTEGTLDSYLYQTVTDKARFIAQLLDNNAPARVSEDCDEKVLSFAEIQAAAEGNPEFKRRIELSNDIAELTMLKSEYDHETALTREQLERYPKTIERIQEKMASTSNDVSAAKVISEQDLTIKTHDGRTLTERKDINEYIYSIVQDMLKKTDTPSPKFNVNEFTIGVRAFTTEGGLMLMDGPHANFEIQGSEHYQMEAGRTENNDNCQRLINFFAKTVPHKLEELKENLEEVQNNMKQSEERINTPWEHEAELEKMQQEFNELEEKLAGLSEASDEFTDSEELGVTTTDNDENKETNDIDSSDIDLDDDDDLTPRR